MTLNSCLFHKKTRGFSLELVHKRCWLVWTELRPLLRNRKTTDDENLTKAVADEMEYQDKFNKPVGRKNISVNSVEPTQEKEKKENPIMKEISELKAQVLANFRQSQPIRHDGRWTNCIKMAPIIAIIGLFAFQVNIWAEDVNKE